MLSNQDEIQPLLQSNNHIKKYANPVNLDPSLMVFSNPALLGKITENLFFGDAKTLLLVNKIIKENHYKSEIKYNYQIDEQHIKVESYQKIRIFLHKKNTDDKIKEVKNNFLSRHPILNDIGLPGSAAIVTGSASIVGFLALSKLGLSSLGIGILAPVGATAVACSSFFMCHFAKKQRQKHYERKEKNLLDKHNDIIPMEMKRKP